MLLGDVPTAGIGGGPGRRAIATSLEVREKKAPGRNPPEGNPASQGSIRIPRLGSDRRKASVRLAPAAPAVGCQQAQNTCASNRQRRWFGDGDRREVVPDLTDVADAALEDLHLDRGDRLAANRLGEDTVLPFAQIEHGARKGVSILIQGDELEGAHFADLQIELQDAEIRARRREEDVRERGARGRGLDRAAPIAGTVKPVSVCTSTTGTSVPRWNPVAVVAGFWSKLPIFMLAGELPRSNMMSAYRGSLPTSR